MLDELTFEQACELVTALTIPYATGEQTPHLAGSDLAACEAALRAQNQDGALAFVRAYYQAPEQLSEDERAAIQRQAPGWLSKLAAAAEVPVREIVTETRRGGPGIDNPGSPGFLQGHWYLGAFMCSGALTVADRCYVNKPVALLAARTPAVAGRWHAYVRVYAGPFDGDPALADREDPHFALLAVHEEHFARAHDTGTQLGIIGVDAGCVTVVDSATVAAPGMAERLYELEPWLDGMLWNFGCTSFTLFGDGMYKVLVVTEKKAAVMVRVNLTQDPYFDHFDSPEVTRERKKQLAQEQQYHEEMSRPDVPIRTYAPSEKYAIGERVRHPKFGDGYVARIVDAGKIELRFQKESRILIQGRR